MYVALGKDALGTNAFARQTVNHELKHIADISMFSEQGILTNVSLNYLELKAYREVNLKPLFISVRRYNWAETVLNRKGFQLGNDYNFKYPLMLFMNFFDWFNYE